MYTTLHETLTSKNGLLRKLSSAVLGVTRWLTTRQSEAQAFATCPVVLANSFPKSGTHLLVQLVEGLPDRANYGTFLASMASSFRFRERSLDNTCRFIRRFAPGEIVRAHLMFDPQFARELTERNAVHYFVYRDPRDVVVSEAHYLRDMNRWHRLAPYFRQKKSMADAIMLSIKGLQPQIPGIDYPNIADRFGRYQAWLDGRDCLPIRFEDLVSEQQAAILQRMAEFYAERSSVPIDVAACVRSMASHIAPQKSHTFRSGKQGGWRREFTLEHRREFDHIAGNLLISLGYESDHDWAAKPQLVAHGEPD